MKEAFNSKLQLLEYDICLVLSFTHEMWSWIYVKLVGPVEGLSRVQSKRLLNMVSMFPNSHE
jgi:hypothetical protein